jgi:hypothetical protein
MECSKLKNRVRAVTCLASSVTDAIGLASRRPVTDQQKAYGMKQA